MAPNSDIIRFSPTPAFAARMLALPVLNDAVNRALDVFDSTKIRKDAMGAALRAAEASMRVAASGALPLATPFVNTVGGWGVVDEWACRGLDKVESVAPIIKKPTKEIVTTTRQTMLKAVAGGTGGVPASLSEAITTRANNAVELVVTSQGGVILMNAADSMLTSAHIMLDNYLPPQKGDRQGKGVPAGGVTIKMSSLYNKTQQRLYRSVYIMVRPPNERSIDGTITIALLYDFGRRTTLKQYEDIRRVTLKQYEDIRRVTLKQYEDIRRVTLKQYEDISRVTLKLYEDIVREPGPGEQESATMALTRSTLILMKKYIDQFMDVIQKQLNVMKTMDRATLFQFLAKSGLTNAGVFVQGGANAIVGFITHVVNNAAGYRAYLEDLLRRAMSEYERRYDADRAAAAASSWRRKNQMERVVSPPVSPPPLATGTVKKKMMGRQ